MRKGVNQVKGLEAVSMSSTALASAPEYLLAASRDAVGRQTSWCPRSTGGMAMALNAVRIGFLVQGAFPRPPPAARPSFLQLMRSER